MIGFISIDRQYTWQLIKSGDHLFNMVVIVHSNTFPLWGLYPGWALLCWPGAEMPEDAILWQGLN